MTIVKSWRKKVTGRVDDLDEFFVFVGALPLRGIVRVFSHSKYWFSDFIKAIELKLIFSETFWHKSFKIVF